MIRTLLAAALLCAASVGCATTEPAVPVDGSAPSPSAVAEDPVLRSVRVQLGEARKFEKDGDRAQARSAIRAAIDTFLSGNWESEDVVPLNVLVELGGVASELGELQSARFVEERVLAARAQTLHEDHFDLQAARLNLASTLAQLGDVTEARTLIDLAIEVFSRTLPESHAEYQKARSNLANTLMLQGDLPAACACFEQVLEISLRTLPEENPDVQLARVNLAFALRRLGDLPAARALQERVLEVMSRNVPDEDPALQRARLELASTLFSQGDLVPTRELLEHVLSIRSRDLADDHPDLQRVRSNLAITLKALGDLRSARKLTEKVLEVESRTLPQDHPDLQHTRLNLASMLVELGELRAGRALQEEVLDLLSRTADDADPLFLMARSDLATTLMAQGDVVGARTGFEAVLETRMRTLPEGHADVQRARIHLAAALYTQGDSPAARAILERVVEIYGRTLPEEHPSLQVARNNLAVALRHQGDSPAARALQEQVLDAFSRALPADHPDVQVARSNLANTLSEMEELPASRALLEEVLEVNLRTLPDEHEDLQKARLGLANVLAAEGEVGRARELQEQALNVTIRTMPDDHPVLQSERLQLARTLYLDADFAAARALQERVLDVYQRTLPENHMDLQRARGSLAMTIAAENALQLLIEGAPGPPMQNESRSCEALIRSVCAAATHSSLVVLASSPSREAIERCAGHAETVGLALSFARGCGGLTPLPSLEAPSFELGETTRGAAIASAELTRRMAREPRIAELRAAFASATEELAGLTPFGTTSSEFHAARVKRESAERALITLTNELSDGRATGAKVEVMTLAARLDERTAVVCFRRFQDLVFEPTGRVHPEEVPRIRETYVTRVCAFVVRQDRAAGGVTGSLTLVDLGPSERLERAVHAWRESLGVGGGRGTPPVSTSTLRPPQSPGSELRVLLLDPLLTALHGCEKLVLVLDDVLHLVAFDALPLDAEGEWLAGDRWRIDTRAALHELLVPASRQIADGGLLVVGGVHYDAEPMLETDPAHAVGAQGSGREVAGILRSGAWSDGFPELSATRAEAEGIRRSFDTAAGVNDRSRLLEGRSATKEQLKEFVSGARYLHVATHGWFAPESFQSWEDVGPLDVKRGVGFHARLEEQVRRLSPMLLCGLALAGANAPENAVGRVPGLITAEELSTLDLAQCELAVLSACDTNVGERRAGLGVASLQRALHMAGARSVITSLWKVPDEATKDLMIEFYRRLWVEKKPKWQALWEAKMQIRNAVDDQGNPKYSTRDWAAWVLTGEPE